jgi:hypothetical protein
MARVHHYGMRDRPSKKGREVQYEATELLGLNQEMTNMICDEIITGLNAL